MSVRGMDVLVLILSTLAPLSVQAEAPGRSHCSRYFEAVCRSECELIDQLEAGLRTALERQDETIAARFRGAIRGYLWEGASSPDVAAVLPAEFLQSHRTLLATEFERLKTSLEAELNPGTNRPPLSPESLEWLKQRLAALSEGIERPGLLDRADFPARVECFSWEHGGGVDAALKGPISAEMKFRQNGLRVSISGTCPAAAESQERDRLGHLGLMCVTRAATGFGYLGVKVPTQPDATTYYVCILKGGRVRSQVPLWLEPDQLYRWELSVEDHGFRTLTLQSEAGAVLLRLRFTGSPEAEIGFAATVRRVGDAAHLAVVFTEPDRP